MSDAPDAIFLQWNGDCDVTMVYGEPYADEVTWSIERIWDGDIEYRRVRECVWRRIPEYDLDEYITGCRHRALGTGLRFHDGYDYCPYCGNRIRVEEA